MYFHNLKDIQYKKKRDGVYFKSITGEKSQLTLIKLDPGVTTDHSHINEQMGYIISGKVELRIGDEIRVLKKGDGYYVPSNTIHGFKVLGKESLEYIEIFTPPKK
jgi:mannose-6-phosphate isomerase-like protein (cupin superfamily)